MTAERQSEPVEKLSTNVVEARAGPTQAERPGGYVRDPESPEATRAEASREDDFPMLEETDLALLEPGARVTYEESKAIHERARAALERCRESGDEAAEAAAAAK